MNMVILEVFFILLTRMQTGLNRNSAKVFLFA